MKKFIIIILIWTAIFFIFKQAGIIETKWTQYNNVPCPATFTGIKIKNNTIIVLSKHFPCFSY